MTISTALSQVATAAALSASVGDDLVSHDIVVPPSAAAVLSASMSPYAEEPALLPGAAAVANAGFWAPTGHHVARLSNESETMGMHYPAIRTANSFTLPYGRLLDHHNHHHIALPFGAETKSTLVAEEKHVAAGTGLVRRTSSEHSDQRTDDERAAVFEALIKLAASSHVHFANATLHLPVSLRGLPYWARASGQRRCIVYLEPRRKTPLYSAIEEFFRASAEVFGHTEAHQYHPHSSMTGFIDIDDGIIGSGQPSGQVLVKIAAYLQTLISRERSKEGFRVPCTQSVSTAYDYPHEGTHKIEVKLDTPELFRKISDGIVAAVPQAKIRAKRMGHISLAYYNKHVKTDNLMSTEKAKKLDDLARSIICAPGSGVYDSDLNHWDIALYELAFKSTVLSAPHRFNQIARWQL
ncbi:hypothetical protein LPJ53_004183 [Coemansia erecta]|uniref:Uncharacterized protein n=1 Tax=Coemansia erecta TaxID=147472 RepID=A0A9W7XXN7_9FUNG|nr:hypothetical protein LPJ53_004183 [Coemansia erecta]